MEFKIIIKYMPDFILVRTGGTAYAGDFDRLLRQITGTPEWVKGTPQIIDHRRLDMKKLDQSEMTGIEQIVEKHRDALGAGPCAIVVKDEVGFGFSRMYELIGGDTIHKEVGIFYSVEEARAWLKKVSKRL